MYAPKYQHSCPEWDGMVIDERDPEFAVCGCYDRIPEARELSDQRHGAFRTLETDIMTLEVNEHTPGPWALKIDPAADAHVTTSDHWHDRIAVVFNDSRRDFKANARLIAAAPELLAALRAAESTLMLVAMGTNEIARLEESVLACAARIRAAIAKADGR